MPLFPFPRLGRALIFLLVAASLQANGVLAQTQPTVVTTSPSASSSASSSSDGKCEDINDCRTLNSIITSCVSTIIACVWLSVHLNIPAPLETQTVLYIRRVRIMIIALLVPELLVTWAIKQWIVARRIRREMKDVMGAILQFVA